MAKHEDVRERLHKAIKKHSGMEDDEIIQAGEHGADSGWPGFTYYTDTVKFYDKNADDIWEVLDQVADDMGEGNALEMIAKFGGAKNVSDDQTFKNLMSWYALEEIGHYLQSERESKRG